MQFDKATRRHSRGESRSKAGSAFDGIQCIWRQLPCSVLQAVDFMLLHKIAKQQTSSEVTSNQISCTVCMMSVCQTATKGVFCLVFSLHLIDAQKKSDTFSAIHLPQFCIHHCSENSQQGVHCAICTEAFCTNSRLFAALLCMASFFESTTS